METGETSFQPPSLDKIEPAITSKRNDDSFEANALSKKGLIRQINISKSQVDRDAWTIKNRIHHLSEEETRALRKIQETKALAESIKRHAIERDSKAQAYKEMQAEMTREVIRKKIAVI